MVEAQTQERRARSGRLPRALRLPPAPTLAEARRPLPWRALVGQAVALWAAVHLAYLTLTFFFPLVTGPVAPTTDAPSARGLGLLWVTRWDAAYFLDIARRGYWAPTPTAFFPLFPLLIRGVTLLIGVHWALASLVAASVGALLAFVGVTLLAAQAAPQGEELATGRAALLLFAAYPLALFLIAGYSDGLFAGLATFALLWAMRRRWLLAAACAFLAGLCRATAPALVAPLLWLALQDLRARRPCTDVATGALAGLRAALAPVLATLAAPAGLGAYCLYLWARFGDPLIFVAVERATWRHESMPPIISLALASLELAKITLFSAWQARIALDLIPILCVILVTILGLPRAPLAFTLYLALLLYIITSEPVPYADLFASGGRYILAATPAFALVGRRLRRSQWLFPALICAAAALQAGLALFFLRQGWLI